MSRRRFSAKALTEHLLSFDGKCAECGWKVGGAAGLEWDHVLPLEMGGDDDLDNLQPLCRPCHRAKTRQDAGHIAKARRMQQRALGIKRQPKGRGFRGWRKFNNDPVWRDLMTTNTEIAMRDALRLALPVMRRTVAEYLDSVMVRSDPATIAPIEWEEVAPDLDAIVAAEACVGRVTEPSWLDAIVDAGKWHDPGRPVPHHGSGGGELR